MPAKAFVEQDCLFSHNGVEYGAGGGYMVKGPDGLYTAFLYVREDAGRMYATTWHGLHLAPVLLGREYRSNMGDRRRPAWCTIDGVKFYGTAYVSAGDYMRLREYRQ